jgi:hypothetical protein
LTEIEAKELIINGMNYAAYREVGTSLFVEDKNRLFGAEHFTLEPHTYSEGKPSPWGTGQDFEEKMAELMRYAVRLGSSKGNYEDAIALLKSGNHYLNQIIQKAGL